MLLLKTVFPYTNFDDIQISFNFDISYIDILCICNKIKYYKEIKLAIELFNMYESKKFNIKYNKFFSINYTKFYKYLPYNEIMPSNIFSSDQKQLLKKVFPYNSFNFDYPY